MAASYIWYIRQLTIVGCWFSGDKERFVAGYWAVEETPFWNGKKAAKEINCWCTIESASRADSILTEKQFAQ